MNAPTALGTKLLLVTDYQHGVTCNGLNLTNVSNKKAD